MPIVETVTDSGSAGAIADVAAATFPLACPPHARATDINGFIDAHLRAADFETHINAHDSDVLVVRPHDGGPIIGYALLHHRPPANPVVAAAVTASPASEISKIYVRPEHHARRTAATQAPSRALMAAARDCAHARGSAVIWLGVNQENERAQRFYAKNGFTRAGTRTFELGDRVEHDYVLVATLP